jgi:thiamine-phosphate pyrophosphorylase
MNCTKESMLLYAITDRAWVGKQTLMEQVKDSLEGGITFLQLREKDLDETHFLKEAREMRALAAQYHVPFVINDNVEIALACGADGVHVGQSDMAASIARDKLGPDKIIGVSAQTVEQALAAEKMGADYLGVGAVFATSTKDADVISWDTLKEICRSVSIPVVAIGGINQSNLLELSGSGIDGVSIISGIYGQPDIKRACQNLRKLSKEMVGL